MRYNNKRSEVRDRVFLTSILLKNGRYTTSLYFTSDIFNFGSVDDNELMDILTDVEEEETTVIAKPKSKKKVKNTSNLDKDTNNLEIRSQAIKDNDRLLCNPQQINFDEPHSKKIKDTSKSKKNTTTKSKSSKKTRLKSKVRAIIPRINKVIDSRIPRCLILMIKKAKLELIDLDPFQQKAIINIIKKLSIEELAIMLLVIPETPEEMKFVKNTFLSKQYIDMLFRNIDVNLIE